HARFFDDPTPTDCISFPMDDAESEEWRVLGEIFVCPKAAIRYTEEHGGNPFIETTLYIGHGLLHLMGYDDMNLIDEEQMRQAEKRHMAHLKALGLLMQ